MDFTHAAFYQGAQQFPPHFMGIHGPPLTPSHSNSAGSDDFNTTSPPVGCPQRCSFVAREEGRHTARTQRNQSFMYNTYIPSLSLAFSAFLFGVSKAWLGLQF